MDISKIYETGNGVINEKASELSYICREIADARVRDEVMKFLLRRDYSSHQELMKQQKTYLKEIVKLEQSHGYELLKQQEAHFKELNELKIRISSLEMENEQIKKHMLMASVLPIIRRHIERCELIWFAPFDEEDLKIVEKEDVGKLQETIKKLSEKGLVTDAVHDVTVNYNYRKWIFIMTSSDRSTLQEMKKNLIEVNGGKLQTDDAVIREFCRNIAVFYSFCSPFIHTFPAANLKPEDILDVLKELGFNDPSFLTTIEILMRFSDGPDSAV